MVRLRRFWRRRPYPLSHRPLIALGQAHGGLCLASEPLAPTTPPQRLRFGITPELAGTVGQGQGAVAPVDDAKRDAALEALLPPRRTLVIRLNRLFMSDGAAGVRRFVRLARAYEHDGFLVESQVRYHPTAEQEGDLGDERFRRAVDHVGSSSTRASSGRPCC